MISSKNIPQKLVQFILQIKRQIAIIIYFLMAMFIFTKHIIRWKEMFNLFNNQYSFSLFPIGIFPFSIILYCIEKLYIIQKFDKIFTMNHISDKIKESGIKEEPPAVVSTRPFDWLTFCGIWFVGPELKRNCDDDDAPWKFGTNKLNASKLIPIFFIHHIRDYIWNLLRFFQNIICLFWCKPSDTGI